MRSLDTNVLARFFVDDADDALAARQRPAAVAAMSERSFVSVTVILELIRSPVGEAVDEPWVAGACRIAGSRFLSPQARVSADALRQFEGGEFDEVLRAPGAAVMDHLGLEQPGDRRGQRILWRSSQGTSRANPRDLSTASIDSSDLSI